MMLALTGCAVGPDFKQPDAPPVEGYLPGQVISRPVEVPGRWWEQLRSQPLNRLVEDGLNYNTDLQAAEAAVRVAQANALAQRGGLFPVAAAGIRQQPPAGAGATLTSDAASGASIYSVHTAQVSVAFIPDVFGGSPRRSNPRRRSPKRRPSSARGCS